MCSNHATVRGLLHELPAEGPFVLVDNEASPEHLSRSTTEAVDILLVIAEPYFKSLETARRYSIMAKELGIPQVSVVANKVRDPNDMAAIEEFCDTNDMHLMGQVPFDDMLGSAERAGVAPVDYDDTAPSVRAIAGLVDEILATTATRSPR